MFLVIGGTGTVGREVVRLLAAAGQRTRVMVRDPFAASALAARGVELVQGDLARPTGLPAVLDGVHRVFLVTPSGPTTPELQIPLIHAARAAGVERLVRVSVLGVGTDVPSRLIGWHAEVEAALARSGLPAVNLRPASFMQNLLGAADLLRRTGQLFATTGDGRRAVVDARDIAAAAVGALLREPHLDEAVAITGPEALSGADQAAVLADVLGRPVQYVDLPPDAARAGLIAAGLPDWLADDLVLLETACRSRDEQVSDGVARLSGTAPRSFRQFVADYRVAFA